MMVQTHLARPDFCCLLLHCLILRVILNHILIRILVQIKTKTKTKTLIRGTVPSAPRILRAGSLYSAVALDVSPREFL